MENGSVLILVDLEIPPGTSAALGKRLGFVPTPKLDTEALPLGMRRTVNNIITLSANNQPEPFKEDSYELPKKLRRVNFNIRPPTTDEVVNLTTTRMEEELHDYTIFEIY